MKVICITSGQQTSENPTVEVGNSYTVINSYYGWEIMHAKADELFYELAEMPDDMLFWSGMFAKIIDTPAYQEESKLAEA